MNGAYTSDLRGRVLDAVDAGSSARRACASVPGWCIHSDPVGATVA